jgi:hypothetical protein
MAIKSNAGPTGGRDVVQQALSLRSRHPRTFSAPLGGGAAVPATGSPVPIYDLTVVQLGQPDPLASAALARWCYPVVEGQHMALVDLRVDDGGRPVEFGGLSRGLLADRFAEAASMAEKLLSAHPADLEPRLLDVPALRFVALWLHGRDEDHFVSLLEGRPPGSQPLALVDDVVAGLRARVGVLPATSPMPGPSGPPTN